MTQKPALTISQGFEAHEREQVAEIYDIAFGSKFGLAIPDETKRRRVFAESFMPEFGLVARLGGELVGVAGVHTTRGSLTGGGTLSGLTEQLGWIGTARAAAVLAMYERAPIPGQLVMDGISVSPTARGRGVGSALLAAVLDYAREHDYESVRLDVIDTNPRARALYERVGFVEGATEEFEFLRGVLGFGATTTMEFPLRQPA